MKKALISVMMVFVSFNAAAAEIQIESEPQVSCYGVSSLLYIRAIKNAEAKAKLACEVRALNTLKVETHVGHGNCQAIVVTAKYTCFE
ncbi:hypothetical protein [Bdellovibrio sp. HCB337]|uniref:hypothetical protein n=1 Tax=Bdellovibrio sp. HCB337 TaxID=3394358 RepID=UPI0039A6B02E